MNILITGASSGIGAALAVHYATKKHSLFITGRNAERLHSVAEQCRTLGARVTTSTIDVTDQIGLKNFIEEVDAATPLDLVIANAGIGLTDDKAPTEQALTLARQTFNVNTLGVLNTLDPIVPRMAQRQRGHVVLVASLAGYAGLATCPMYAATKNFVRAYGDGLCGSLAAYNIAVSVVCPGFVESRITANNTCPMPFLMPADKAAVIIAKGIARRKPRIAFPAPMVFAVWLLSILPSVIRLNMNKLLPPKAGT